MVLLVRLFLRTALKKLDWYCDWEDVTVEAGMYTINSAKVEEAVFSKENYVLWDGKTCFAQVNTNSWNSNKTPPICRYFKIPKF